MTAKKNHLDLLIAGCASQLKIKEAPNFEFAVWGYGPGIIYPQYCKSPLNMLYYDVAILCSGELDIIMRQKTNSIRYERKLCGYIKSCGNFESTKIYFSALWWCCCHWI